MEILVHISAPTTRQDDDHFRAQALAYLDFQPCNTVYVTESKGVDEVRKECLHKGIPQNIFRTSTTGNTKVSPSPSSERPLNAATPVEQADSDLYGSFPSVTPLSNCGEEQTSLNSGSPPDPDSCSVLQSSKTPIEQLELIQTLWKTQQRLSASEVLRHPPKNERRPISAAESNSILFHEEYQLAAAALQSQLLDSLSSSFELELAPSHADSGSTKPIHLLTENSPAPRIERCNDNSFPDINTPSHLPHSPKQPASFGLTSPNFTNLTEESDMVHSTSNPSCEASSSQSLGKQFVTGKDAISRSTSIESLQPQLKRGHKQDAERQPSCGGDRTDPDRGESQQNTKVTSSGAVSFLSIPLEVLPPGPRISDSTPATWPSQSTEALDILRDAPENVGRFKPLWTTRNLAMDERGHWRIDTAGWKHQLQYRFWHDLGNFIRRGDAGWGVTLHREPPSPKNENCEDVNGLGQVQLYCWGELIEHTYLLIWLYSNGEVRGSGLQWIDSADAVVVQMP